MNEQQPQNSMTMPQEQQQYIQVLANKKRLNMVGNKLAETKQFALDRAEHPDMFRIVQQINSAEQVLQMSVNNLVYQQKQIEKTHPEYKAQAIAHAKSQQQAQTQTQQAGAYQQAAQPPAQKQHAQPSQAPKQNVQQQGY
jgi:hypothetical protein